MSSPTAASVGRDAPGSALARILQLELADDVRQYVYSLDYRLLAGGGIAEDEAART